jgi:ubiquinone/menaquinone biosynthesis C-methylase UbiE
MADNSQKEAFLKYEADNYFLRNKEKAYEAEKDFVVKVLREYNGAPKNVLEIGCSTGYRLEGIRNQFPGSKVSGIEPSSEAIAKGKKDFPQVSFFKGTADDMAMFESKTFDLVIIGFVLYVVDRDILLKVISETDRVLSDGGTLMIIDFFADKPVRNPYQHIQDMEAFAFKQNYDEIFIATKLYHTLDKRSMSHTTMTYDLSGDYYNKYSLTTLRKDLNASYK